MASRKAKAKLATNAETTAKKVFGRPFKSGAEWAGNAAGRPKGSRHKLEEDFVSDLCEAWRTHGKAAMEKLATTDVAVFVKVAASVIPRESKVTVDIIDNMNANELRDFIAGEIEALGIGHKAPPAIGRERTSRRQLN